MVENSSDLGQEKERAQLRRAESKKFEGAPAERRLFLRTVLNTIAPFYHVDAANPDSRGISETAKAVSEKLLTFWDSENKGRVLVEVPIALATEPARIQFAQKFIAAISRIPPQGELFATASFVLKTTPEASQCIQVILQTKEQLQESYFQKLREAKNLEQISIALAKLDTDGVSLTGSMASEVNQKIPTILSRIAKIKKAIRDRDLKTLTQEGLQVPPNHALHERVMKFANDEYIAWKAESAQPSTIFRTLPSELRENMNASDAEPVTQAQLELAMNSENQNPEMLKGLLDRYLQSSDTFTITTNQVKAETQTVEQVVLTRDKIEAIYKGLKIFIDSAESEWKAGQRIWINVGNTRGNVSRTADLRSKCVAWAILKFGIPFKDDNVVSEGMWRKGIGENITNINADKVSRYLATIEGVKPFSETLKTPKTALDVPPDDSTEQIDLRALRDKVGF